MESKDNVQQEQSTQGTGAKVQMSTRVEEKKKANKKIK